MMFSSLTLSRHKESSKVSTKTSTESIDQQTVRQINRSELSPDYQQLIKANLELRQQYSEIVKKVRDQARQIEQLRGQRLDRERQVKQLGRQLENVRLQSQELRLNLVRIMLFEKDSPEKMNGWNAASKDKSYTDSMEQLEMYKRNIYKLFHSEVDNYQTQSDKVISQAKPLKQLSFRQTMKLFLRHHLNTISQYQQKIQSLQQQILTTNSLASTVEALHLLVPKLQAESIQLSFLRKQQRLALRSQQIDLKFQQHAKEVKIVQAQAQGNATNHYNQEEDCQSIEEQMEMIRQSHIGCDEQGQSLSVYSICKKVLDEYLEEEQSKSKKMHSYAITRHSNRQSTRQSNRHSNTFFNNDNIFPLFHVELYHQSLAYYISKLTNSITTK